MHKYKEKEQVLTVVLILAALIICIPIASVLSQPATYTNTIASLDEKMGNVLSLTAACTVASTAVTAVPDDIGTPIANQLAEYTEYLLLIFSVLLAEKYMLTILGLVSFRIALPLAMLLTVPYMKRKAYGLHQIAWKLTAFLLALYLVIPVSMGISDSIAKTFDISFQETIEASEQFRLEETENNSLWEKMSETVKYAADSVTHLPQKASDMMNRFIQSIAVMIVTSCIIPLLVLIFALRMAKMLTGNEIQWRMPPRENHRRQIPQESREIMEIEK